MDRSSPTLRLCLGLGYGLAGALFFFAIIGVFGLRLAIGSLVLFVILTFLSVFRSRDGSDKA